MNRLARFWRPMLDLTDSELAPMRLRLIAPVASWLADPEVERWSWFAMTGVPGLRHQVVRHAGLREYDARDPSQLPMHLQTPAWKTLLSAIEEFNRVSSRRQTLIVWQLAQLSYGEFVLKLCPLAEPDGDPDRDRRAYEIARVYLRYPGRGTETFPVFLRLAEIAIDPMLALSSCFQGVGHAIRLSRDVGLAHAFADRGRKIIATHSLSDSWHGKLVLSRFYRSLALLNMTEGDLSSMQRDLQRALAFDAQLTEDAADKIDCMLAKENRRILVEAQIRAAARDQAFRESVDVIALCQSLAELDPFDVEARTVIGEGYAATGDLETAAYWYTRAGELGTAAGAVGYFRAAQCLDLLGDRWGALNCMGRCLDLDNSAVEARLYLKDRPRA